MTRALWSEAVRLAKIKNGRDPETFIRIQGKLLLDSQAIYHILQTAASSKKNRR